MDTNIRKDPNKHSPNISFIGKILSFRNIFLGSIFALGLAILIFQWQPFTLKDSEKVRFSPGTAYDEISSDLDSYTKYFEQDFSNEENLLSDIRAGLLTGKEVKAKDNYHFDFNPYVSQLYITLFQKGMDPIRWGSKRSDLSQSIERAIQKIRENNRFKYFDVRNPEKCRILFEIVQNEKEIPLTDLDSGSFTENRFEPGITGLKFIYDNRVYYYMPTDATVQSHLNLKHVLNEMSKKIGLGKLTNKISERIEILTNLEIKCFLITSKAFVTYGNKILPLYRGYPAPVQFSKENILNTFEKACDWILDNMNSDGSFLYYYDPVKDTVKDHQHSRKRTLDNLYYNSLRHSGGTITLLKRYEQCKDIKYLTAAKKSLEFLINNMRQTMVDNKTSYYVYFNNKAKLGGTGIALTAFVRYFMASGDETYHPYMEGMVRHILSRIEPDGEMIGYYIHPDFNNGAPILNPSNQEKKDLFSFYYPGEALLGLALYERVVDTDPAFRRKMRALSRLALDFLVDIRPIRYTELFKPLPSDGWLMQAIEEWSRDETFQEKNYLDFVFNDAKAMLEHMYTERNSKYYDYPGSFFYHYGDVSYPDGARSEGLIAAYYLAKRLGKRELSKELLDACIRAATSLLYTYNSDASTYMHKYPEKAMGTFRFKYTRQWVRVDSVQHTACFYIRLFDAL